MKFQAICLLLLVDCLITLCYINGAEQFHDDSTNVEENVDACSSIDDRCVNLDRNPVDANKHAYRDNKDKEEQLVFRDDANDIITKDIDIEQDGYDVSEDIQSEQDGKDEIQETKGAGGAGAEYYWSPLARINPGK